MILQKNAGKHGPYHAPVLAVLSNKSFQNFFIFTILGEEILVRVQSWTTSVNTEHLPKQSSVDSQLQHTLPWLHLPKHRWFRNMFSLPIPSHYFIYDSVYTTVMSLSKTATIVWLFVLPWILCCKPWRLMPHHQLALLLEAVWGCNTQQVSSLWVRETNVLKGCLAKNVVVSFR